MAGRCRETQPRTASVLHLPKQGRQLRHQTRKALDGPELRVGSKAFAGSGSQTADVSERGGGLFGWRH